MRQKQQQFLFPSFIQAMRCAVWVEIRHAVTNVVEDSFVGCEDDGSTMVLLALSIQVAEKEKREIDITASLSIYLSLSIFPSWRQRLDGKGC